MLLKYACGAIPGPFNPLKSALGPIRDPIIKVRTTLRE